MFNDLSGRERFRPFKRSPGLEIEKKSFRIIVYVYLRKNSTKFTVEEPLITNITFFEYTRIQQKKDGLVILFDKNGVVKNYGYQKGTKELTPF